MNMNSKQLYVKAILL